MRSSKVLKGLLFAAILAAGGCEGHGLHDSAGKDLLPPAAQSGYKDGAYRDSAGTAATRGTDPQSGLLAGAPKNGLAPVKETVARGTGQFTNAGSFEPAKTSSGQDGITLNLLNVPVQQAAKIVLGDILKLNYTIADKAAGNVTLQTSAPVPVDGLIEAFEVALRTSGLAIVNSGGFYKIVPSTGVAQSGVPMATRRNTDSPGIQNQIIPIRHIGVADMKRVLEPIVPAGAVARIDPARNLMVVSGTQSELANINNLVQIFDVDYMKGMSFALYPVKTSDPEAISSELETIFGLDKEGPMKGVVRFIPNRRLGSVLVISSKPDQIAKAKGWIDKLDKAAQQGEQQLFVYKIQNRQAAELASLLQRVLTVGERRPSDAAGAVAPRFEAAATTAPAEDGRHSSTATGSSALLGTAAGDNTSAARSFLNSSASQGFSNSSGGSSANHGHSTAPSFEAGGTKVVADEQDNALVIQATPKEYQRILTILQRLDRQPTQVMLEAVIAEITLNDELKFGLKWYVEKNPSIFSFSDAANGAIASSFPGFSYFFSTKNLKFALDAMSAITKVNVVSAPSLMVMDNKKATLQIGDQVPIVTQTAQSVIATGAPAVNTITMKDTGVILSVTPRVNDSGRVVLDIEQEVSSVAKTTSSGIDSPTIQQRRIRTTITVRDGEALALGGLIQQNDSVTKTQVPILGNIPIIGPAFGTKSNDIKRTELVIFIRPQVVRDDGEAARVTEEFRSRIALEPLQPTRGNRHYERDINRILR